MSIRGRQAERAVGLACVHYRRAGRADIAKQATGMRRVGGTYVHTTKASIDFKGTLAGGRSISIEVKEHDGVSFPLNESTLSTSQRQALDLAATIGGEVLFVVDLPDQNETYVMQWVDVQRFITAPYRASLSLQWMRTHGQLCNVTQRDRPNHRAIWFLDAKAHPERETAYLAEAAERAKSPLIELDAVKPRAQVVSSRPNKATDPEGYERHIGALMQQGTERQLGAKKKAFGRRGRG